MNMTDLLLPALVVLGVLVALVAVFVVVRFLLRVRRRAKEIGSLKDDLMIWRNLSSLVRGGEGAADVKATLSARLSQLRRQFADGRAMLGRVTAGSDRRPWFVVVGEPRAGKTTLLAKSGVELRPSADLAAGEERPLVCWLGSRSFTLDVAGRVFFDRWLKGSGAEWTALTRLVRRHHRRRPLDGIVLVVPADALIADGEDLTREKTAVIGAELHQLLTTVGMNLPCHLVVTKADMLAGWREFFAGLTPAERERTFGWRNPAGRGFDAESFESWFKTTVARFREAAVARMLQPGREGAARAYLLPDAFAAVEGNLRTYLDRVFGVDAWSGHDRLTLGGVFFTSAEDTGVVLSGDYAADLGKSPEDCPIAAPPEREAPSCFVKSLLRDFVFPCRAGSSFTAVELFRRQLWGYAAAALLAALGVLWITTAQREQGRLSAQLKPSADYYRALESILADGVLAKAPMFEVGTNGVVTMKHESPFPTDPRYSRLKFLHNARMAAEADMSQPLGFRAAAFALFGWRPSIGVSDRRFVFNRVQAEMVFLPALRGFQTMALAGFPGVFSQLRRDAFFSYNSAAFTLDNPRHATEVEPILMTLLPVDNPDLIRLFSSYYPDRHENNVDLAAEIVYDWNYSQAQKTLLKGFLDDWEALRIYPESVYPKTRKVVTTAVKLENLVGRTAEFANGLGGDDEARAAALAEWHAQIGEIAGLEEELDRAVEAVSGENDLRILSEPERPAVAIPEELKKKLPAVADAEKALNEKAGALMTVVRPDPVEVAGRECRRMLEADATGLRRDFSRIRGIFAGIGGNAYTRIGLDHLDRSFQTIGEKLEAEIDRLQEDWTRISEKRLFDPVEREKKDAEPAPDEPRYVFKAVGRLFRAAAVMANRAELGQSADFAEVWSRQQALSDAAAAEFEATAAYGAADPTVSALVPPLRALIAAQRRENAIALLNRYVELHPLSAADVANWVAARAKDDDFDVSEPLYAEVFGKLPCNVAYDPKVGGRIIDSFRQASAVVHPAGDGDGKDAKKAAEPPLAIKYFDRTAHTMNGYIADYVRYWGSYADGLGVNAGDWRTFRRYAGTVKPYAVNFMLTQIYGRCRAKLRALPDAALDASLRKRRDTAIAVIETRLQLLGSSDLPESCQRTAAAWSTLPVEPQLAYKRLRTADAGTLLADYFAVWATGTKEDVPWWSRFCDTGLSLVKIDARKEGLEMLRKGQGKFLRFPVCKDPVDATVSSVDDLKDMKEHLLSCGFRAIGVEVAGTGKSGASSGKPAEKAAEKQEPADERDSVILARVRSPEPVVEAKTPAARKAVKMTYSWGDNALTVVEAVVDYPAETVWTLSVPSLAKRIELTRAHFPEDRAGVHRYRYGRFEVDGKQRGSVISLDSSEERVFARGTIADRNAVLTLSAFSDPDDRCASAEFPGEWAIARLYTLPGTVIEKDAMFIPVVVTDRFDLKTVFWVKFAFNRRLPPPADWPAVGNWLDMPRK